MEYETAQNMIEANDESRSRVLRIGDMAPDFSARTTMGDFTLSQCRGKWLVFFSHPADFTPVCTTEFLGLAKAADKFAALNCMLVGLSVDSLFAHLAWMRAIRDLFDINITFPVIEDPGMVVGRAFGMIDGSSQDSASIRSTYFIDPEGVIRAITTYPHNVGRSVDEILRMVAALQRADGDDVLTPEGWQPGDEVLLPPAVSLNNVTGNDGLGADWFCKRIPDK